MSRAHLGFRFGYTLADETLPHQIVLQMSYGSQATKVTCNCRRYKSGTGTNAWIYMGKSKTLPEAARIYNDPANHNNHLKPFTDKDKLPW